MERIHRFDAKGRNPFRIRLHRMAHVNIYRRERTPLRNRFAPIWVWIGPIFQIEYGRPCHLKNAVADGLLHMKLGFCLQPDKELSLIVKWPVETAQIKINQHDTELSCHFTTAMRC